MPNQDPYGPSAEYRNTLDVWRDRFAKVPGQPNWDVAQQSTQQGQAAGGISDPTGLPNVNLGPNQFAPQAAMNPDIAPLQAQSGMMRGFASMTPMGSPTHLNMAPLGETPLTAYIQARNNAQVAQMQDQTQKEQANRDLYNRLLEIRQNQTMQFANKDASQDIQQANSTLEQRAKAAQDKNTTAATIAGAKIDAQHEDVGVKAGAAETIGAGHDTAHVEAVQAGLRPKLEAQRGDIQFQINNANLLGKALDDSEDFVKKNPTPLLDAASKPGFTPLANGAKFVTRELGSTNFDQAEPTTRLRALVDAQVANNNKFGRPTNTQVELTNNDFPVADDPSSVKLNKIAQARQKNLNHLSSLQTKMSGLQQAAGQPQQVAPAAAPDIHSQAVDWAKSHPNDPRSAEILRRNGVQ